jgi:peptidyl-tRNA hydrolase, PTH1 family
MKVIVWLGNPGKKYENTRHNVGYMMVDLLQKKWGGSEWEESRFSGMISEWKTDTGESIILLKPTTFMNLSGDAVASIVNYYKLDPSADLIVISDDIDMEFGKVRKREKWSHGGQNGLRDIITKLWSDQFTRIKIGIGRDDRYDVSDWVLSKLTLDEWESIASVILWEVEKIISSSKIWKQ